MAEVQVTNETVSTSLALNSRLGKRQTQSCRASFQTTPMNSATEKENDTAYWTMGFGALQTHCLKIIIPVGFINSKTFNDILKRLAQI